MPDDALDEMHVLYFECIYRQCVSNRVSADRDPIIQNGSREQGPRPKARKV